MENQQLIDALAEAKLLEIFKSFCEKAMDENDVPRIRKIFHHTNDYLQTTKNVIYNSLKKDLKDSELERMNDLIQAFLNKSDIRRNIDSEIKENLLIEQGYKCALCGTVLDTSAPADHIVPFKYVGDSLKNNLQMLCQTCNSKKNASIDYQIRWLLKS